MRAMILAAGRGVRMGELTRDVPKPLITYRGQYLIEYSLQALSRMGIRDIVVNVCYRAEQIKDALGNGERYGVNIFYSDEAEALETGGGIYQALPILGNEPFVVLSSDIVTDFPLQTLPRQPQGLAHIVMVENPSYHPNGDFGLVGNRICLDSAKTFTFANIGVYRPELFADSKPGRFRLGDLLKREIINQQVTGEYYAGFWRNVGTPADLVAG